MSNKRTRLIGALAMAIAIMFAACGTHESALGEGELGDHFAGKGDSLVGAIQQDNGHPQIGSLLNAEQTVFCVGTLIGSRTVVTAAHCRELEPIGPYVFQLGGQDYVAEKIMAHFSFDEGDLSNDVALIKLTAPVQVITPAKLFLDAPAVNQPLPAVRLTAGGKQLQTVTAATVEETTFSYVTSFPTVKNPLGRGAPTFARGADGEERLVGIQSEARPGESIDTRIDGFAQWIRLTAGGDVTIAPLSGVPAGIVAGLLEISPISSDGQTVKGAVKLSIKATSDAGISSVMFSAECCDQDSRIAEYILDVAFDSVGASDVYSGEWNTASFVDGPCLITARITDQGHRQIEVTKDVTISNGQ